MNQLESALHALTDDGSSAPARPELADRVLARARQRSHRRSALAVVSAGCAAALIAVGVSTVGQQNQHRSAPVPAAGSAATAGLAKPRVNVLLIGSDAAADRIGTRPDTIVLASVDTRTGTTTLFGFPRNLEHVPFPPGSAQAAAFPSGFSCADHACLLNALWHWADNGGAKYYRADRNPGLTATTQAIEQISGLTVDDTVVVTMQGVAQLVDAVGGVEVNVRERLPIGGTPQIRQATGGYLEKGRQRLNGEQALWYARSRWSTNDFDRMFRQQCLITALAGQLDPRALLSAYPKIIKTLRQNLQTSIPADQLPRWAELSKKAQQAPVEHVGLGSAGDLAAPDFTRIREQVTQALGHQPAGGQASAGGWMAGQTC